MASKVYTLTELVDIALKTPEIGAVNFNVLRIVLLKIVTECKLQNVTAEWKPTNVSNIVEISEEQKLPDHPLLLKIDKEKQNKEAEELRIAKEKQIKEAEELRIAKEKQIKEAEELRIAKEKKIREVKEIWLKKKTAVSSDDEEKEKAHVSEKRELISKKDYDTKTVKNETEKHLGKEKDSEPSVSQEEKSIQPEKSEITTETVKFDDVIPSAETTPVTTDLESSTEAEKSEDEEKGKKSKKSHSKKRSPEGKAGKGMKAGSNLWHMWQIKKLMKRVEGLEEELTSLVDTIDELQDLKSLKGKKILFEQGERMQSGYSGPVVDRGEFEHTIDELGEALARVSVNMKELREECSTKNQDIWKEMRLKVSVEDLNRSKEPLSMKLKTLGVAVRNIQRLIKEIVYPESCGITKCMACRRKAHLPHRPLIIDKKEEISRKDKESEEPRNVNENIERESSSTLKFTKRILRGNRKMDDVVDKKLSDEKILKNVGLKKSEMSIDPSHIVNVETFDIMTMAKSFKPLRRSSIFIPVSRPKASLTITVENMN